MKTLKELFEMKIKWDKNESNDLFITFIEGEKYELKMNDFPEEPLFTLIYKDKCIDFDENPIVWEFPWRKSK